MRLPWFRVSYSTKYPKYEKTVLGRKDSEIQRLMSEMGVAKQSLCEQLQASLAASSASRVGNIVEEVPVPVHDSVQPVAVETQSTNNAILETIRSCQPDQMGFQTVLTRHSSTWPKWRGCLSLPPSGLPIPTKRFPN
jgi:hypothetical protein